MLIVDPRGVGDIDECPVSLVQEKPITPITGDIDVRESIVVHISDGDPHSIKRNVQSCLPSDIGELTIRSLPP